MQRLYYLKYKIGIQVKAQTAAVLMGLYALVFACIHFAKCLFKTPYWKIGRAWSSSKEINKSSKHVDGAPIRLKAQKLPPKNTDENYLKKSSHQVKYLTLLCHFAAALTFPVYLNLVWSHPGDPWSAPAPLQDHVRKHQRSGEENEIINGT